MNSNRSCTSCLGSTSYSGVSVSTTWRSVLPCDNSPHIRAGPASSDSLLLSLLSSRTVNDVCRDGFTTQWRARVEHCTAPQICSIRHPDWPQVVAFVTGCDRPGGASVQTPHGVIAEPTRVHKLLARDGHRLTFDGHSCLVSGRRQRRLRIDGFV